MKIRYGAELFVDPWESEFDIYVFIPIVIGTVPIVQNNQNYEQLKSFTQLHKKLHKKWSIRRETEWRTYKHKFKFLTINSHFSIPFILIEFTYTCKWKLFLKFVQNFFLEIKANTVYLIFNVKHFDNLFLIKNKILRYC